MSNNTTLLEDVMGTPVAVMEAEAVMVAVTEAVMEEAVTEAVMEEAVTEAVTEAEAVMEAEEVVTEAVTEAVTEEVMTAAIVMVTPHASASISALASSLSAILCGPPVAMEYRPRTSFEIPQGYIVNADGKVKIKDAFGKSVLEVLKAKNVPYHDAVSSNKIKIAYYGPNGYFVGDIRVTKDDDKCYCEINRSSGCSGACVRLYTMIQAKFSSEVPTIVHTELFSTPLEVPEELHEIVPESSPEEKFGPFLWMLNAEFSDVSEQGLMALAKTAENSVLAREMFKYTVLFDAICKQISSASGELCCMYSIITLSLIARAIAQDKEQIAVLKEKLSELSESSVSSVFNNLVKMVTTLTKDSSLYDRWKAKYCSDILGVLNAVFVTSVY
jgi:hypothetical protein